jgi:hypothetical protein
MADSDKPLFVLASALHLILVNSSCVVRPLRMQQQRFLTAGIIAILVFLILLVLYSKIFG